MNSVEQQIFYTASVSRPTFYFCEANAQMVTKFLARYVQPITLVNVLAAIDALGQSLAPPPAEQYEAPAEEPVTVVASAPEGEDSQARLLRLRKETRSKDQTVVAKAIAELKELAKAEDRFSRFRPEASKETADQKARRIAAMRQ